MANLVIVAIPAEDDYVWKISSEKVPHLTLLFLGDSSESPNVQKVIDFVEHASETVLTRFSLSVKNRGLLGADDADVVFFDNYDRWGMKGIADFRASLLQNDNIKALHDAAPQFEEPWRPHLTLGYPKAPAKPDVRDYPGIRYVDFDRIAVWTGNFEGPEFQLNWDRDMDVLAWAEKGEKALEHHGILGMRWGFRKGKGVSGARKKGGPPSADSSSASEAQIKLKKQGVNSLSNEEIQKLVTRVDLERKLSDLPGTSPQAKVVKSGAKFTGKIISNIATQQVTNLANKVVTKQVEMHLAKHLK